MTASLQAGAVKVTLPVAVGLPGLSSLLQAGVQSALPGSMY